MPSRSHTHLPSRCGRVLPAAPPSRLDPQATGRAGLAVGAGQPEGEGRGGATAEGRMAGRWLAEDARAAGRGDGGGRSARGE